MLQRLSTAGLSASLCNDGRGPLNEGCGADFVKIKQAAPSGVSVTPGRRFVSLDGDADRIVYFFFDDSGAFRLLDGDRIALLLAHFLAKLLKEAGIEGLRLGLVQTAYANGASTRRAVEAVGAANVLCAKTGVKHCHHAALELDVGIYFEANGHGTAIFSDVFTERVVTASRGGGDTGAAAHRLLTMRDVINEAVGDAISIMLAVEVVLRSLDWSCSEWLAMYADLPNRQIKVKVADRSLFETTDAERVCVKPEGLQAEIDALVKLQPQGRAFVRPSGTEDVVRVYAEAESLEGTLVLAQGVVDVVYAKAGGVGEKPTVT
jgi:phosphoacetylglucosamine mutase